MRVHARMRAVSDARHARARASCARQVGLSAFANVYTERVLKDWRQEELALQNALLYAYGAGLNALALFPTAAAQGRLSDPFGGWNAYTFALVFATATTGLLTRARWPRCSPQGPS